MWTLKLATRRVSGPDAVARSAPAGSSGDASVSRTSGSAPSTGSVAPEGGGHGAQPVTEVGMGDVGQGGGPFAHGAPGQVGRSVLGDDDAGVVAGGGDHRPLGQGRHDPGTGDPVGDGGRPQAD